MTNAALLALIQGNATLQGFANSGQDAALAAYLESGVSVSCSPIRTGSAVGMALDSVAQTATSSSGGLVQFSGLFPGVTYLVSRGTGLAAQVCINTLGMTTQELPSLIGTP